MNRPPVPIPDYPSNSMANKSKQTAQSEEIITPRKPRKNSLKSMWDEHSDDVKSYILYDILAPAVKDMISNIVSSAVVAIREQIDTALYGSPRSGGYSYSKSRTSKIDYSSQYRGKNRYSKLEDRVDTTSYNTGRHGVQNSDGWFDDIRPFSTRQKCEKALNKLIALIDEYGEASVGDLYDFAEKSYDFTDRKWGWTDLSHTDVIRVRDGYIIAGLPEPKPLT